MEIDKNWHLNTLGSFVATVLGIVLTFGVSKLSDVRNANELQRQCVYNAISDINNVIKVLQKDSAYCAAWYPMLPDYVERHAEHKDIPLDTAATYFLYAYNMHSSILGMVIYEPIGQTTIESITPTNAFDMQLHRYIYLAYQEENEAFNLEEEFYKFYNRMIDLKIKIISSSKEYSPEEIVDCFLDDDTIQQFSYILKCAVENDSFGNYMKRLRDHRQRILNYSGLTEDDYQTFMEQVDKKQNVESKDKVD